jgi:hypothetical protein
MPEAAPEERTVRRVELVPAAHPHAVELLAARRAAYPHWAAGWHVGGGDEFLVVYEGAIPAAGAAIRHGSDGISRASRLCATAGPADAGAGAALLRALEALALGAGSTRLRVDSSAFLTDAHIPWQQHGYRSGPPYEGDPDVEMWAERSLDPRG